MNPLTRPIRVVINKRERGYQLKTFTAYAGLFTLAAGDAVRYSIGWSGWAVVLTGLLILTIAQIANKDFPETLKRVPMPLYLLLGLMLLSSIWSFYLEWTLVALLAQISTTIYALFLVSKFNWRHLLLIFSNLIRFILAASILFELFAATIIRGPIAPLFPNYLGDTPPSEAYYWTQGEIFTGERIQGIVGNANLIAFLAMIGLVIFGIEFAIIATKRWLSVLGLVLSIAILLLAKSAGITFALLAVFMATVVSLAAEGKIEQARHKIYRIAISFGLVMVAIVIYFRVEIFDLLGKSPDMTGRVGIWQLVLGLIEQRPLQGWGWISYWVPGVKPFEGLVVIENVPYYQAHNALLDIWLQLGVVGVGLILWLVVLTFIRLWRLGVRHTSNLYLWPILVFVGLLVQNLTESRMLIELGWILLVVFATKVNEPEDYLEPRGKTTKRVRLLGLGLRRSQSQRRKDR
jgi:exopolysaccharide production protein ExoQ